MTDGASASANLTEADLHTTAGLFSSAAMRYARAVVGGIDDAAVSVDDATTKALHEAWDAYVAAARARAAVTRSK